MPRECLSSGCQDRLVAPLAGPVAFKTLDTGLLVELGSDDLDESTGTRGADTESDT